MRIFETEKEFRAELAEVMEQHYKDCRACANNDGNCTGRCAERVEGDFFANNDWETQNDEN